MKMHTHTEYGLVAEVSNAKGWILVVEEDGTEHKVRASTLTFVEEIEEETHKRGDVFPLGIRETYERGKTEEGAPFIDNGDPIAKQLRGWTVEQVAKLAATKCGGTQTGWIEFYTTDRLAEGKKALNPGMIRMNLGNRIRAALANEEVAKLPKTGVKAA